jgi:hypothetical protein
MDAAKVVEALGYIDLNCGKFYCASCQVDKLFYQEAMIVQAQMLLCDTEEDALYHESSSMAPLLTMKRALKN